MSTKTVKAVAGISLIAGFGFMGTAPFIADYVVLVGGLIGLALAWRNRGAVREPAAIMLYAALLLLGVTIPFVYRAPIDLLPLVACLPLLAAPGIATLLEKNRYWFGPHAMPLLCLFGVATAVALGISEAYSTDVDRVGAGNNPIHFGGIATILGFLALSGAVWGKSQWRILYLLGPALALVGVLLSGSRGPLLGWIALAVVSAPVLLFGMRNWKLATATLVIGAIGVAVFVAVSKDTVVVQRILALGLTVTETAMNSGPLALAIDFLEAQDPYRTAMYQAGWEALRSSPLVGVGYGQMMPLAASLHPEFVDLFTSLENLHSDVADFAAMAGLLGVSAYLLILFSPLVALRRLPLSANPAAVLIAVVLVVGYATLGLTNAMFGVLPQTALFAVGLGYLIGFCRHLRGETEQLPEQSQ